MKLFTQGHLTCPDGQGELDEMRLVEGIAGARNIYRPAVFGPAAAQRSSDDGSPVRRRATAEEIGGEQVLPKRIKFVMDCSGSFGK